MVLSCRGVCSQSKKMDFSVTLGASLRVTGFHASWAEGSPARRGLILLLCLPCALPPRTRRFQTRRRRTRQLERERAAASHRPPPGGSRRCPPGAGPPPFVRPALPCPCSGAGPPSAPRGSPGLRGCRAARSRPGTPLSALPPRTGPRTAGPHSPCPGGGRSRQQPRAGSRAGRGRRSPAAAAPAAAPGRCGGGQPAPSTAPPGRGLR